MEVDAVNVLLSIINAAVKYAVPITFGALSGIVSERSGIVNIAIEGMMLSGAFAAFMSNVFFSQSSIPAFLNEQPIRLGLAILAAMLVGALIALVHGVLSIRYKVDQIISGTVLNIFALGITGYLYLGGQNTLGRLPEILSNPFSKDAGLLYVVGGALTGQGFLTYLSWVLVPVLGYMLFRTTWGLRTRAIGENPRAADTLGVNVHRMQYTNLAISGALAALGGATLVLEGVSFERGMTSGRGFIALAVMIFGVWRPSLVFLGALMLGVAGALQSQFQFMNINIPRQFVSMLPYILTLVVLAGFMGRARPPASVGQAYEVE